MHKVYLQNHEYAKLANELRAVANQFADTQQLRSRLVGVLEQFGVFPEHRREKLVTTTVRKYCCYGAAAEVGCDDDCPTKKTTAPSAQDLRNWAKEPMAGTPMVPVHKDTLSALADRMEAKSWTGCGECDTSFACYGGKTACIRTPLDANSTERIGWKEAAIAWNVCASVHRTYAKGRDALYTTRQADYVRHHADASAMATTGALEGCTGGPGECAFHKACMYACGTAADMPSPWQGMDSAPRNRLILLGVEYGRADTQERWRQRKTFVAQAYEQADGSIRWHITTDSLGWTRMHSGWRPMAWRDLPSWYHTQGDGTREFQEWLNERRDWVVANVFGDIVERYDMDLSRAVALAEDAVLEEIPCDCGDRRRERGDHLSGCHLFDASEARRRKP